MHLHLYFSADVVTMFIYIYKLQYVVLKDVVRCCSMQTNMVQAKQRK